MKTKKSHSLYCWRQFCKWHKRSSEADARARYWLKRHNEAQTP